jgi:hypothetical protein
VGAITVVTGTVPLGLSLPEKNSKKTAAATTKSNRF